MPQHRRVRYQVSSGSGHGDQGGEGACGIAGEDGRRQKGAVPVAVFEQKQEMLHGHRIIRWRRRDRVGQKPGNKGGRPGAMSTRPQQGRLQQRLDWTEISRRSGRHFAKVVKTDNGEGGRACRDQPAGSDRGRLAAGPGRQGRNG